MSPETSSTQLHFASLHPAARRAEEREAFANHLAKCGHCRSFPRSLCDEGLTLLVKAAQGLDPWIEDDGNAEGS